MRPVLRPALGAALCAFTLTLAGCSESGVKVGGQVTSGSSPFKAQAGETVRLGLADEAGKNNFDTEVSADGTFSFTGSNNQGVPAGKYKVSITRYVEKGAKGPPTPKSLPDVWDVSESSKTFTVDLAKAK